VLGELGEEESLFETAVAAADHGEVLGAAVERSVTRRTEVDAGADEVGLTVGVGASVGRTVAMSTAGARTESPVERSTRIIGPSRSMCVAPTAWRISTP
jgi:hypothetical protein